MRTAEKKYRNQESSNLPTSIGSWVKTVAVLLGFYVWGVDFLWVVLGWSIICSVIRGILSCLFSLLVLGGLISFLINHIF